MSYILDALRKSERERTPVDGLSIGERDPGPGNLPPRELLIYLAPIIGGAALLGGIYLLWAQPFAANPPAAVPTPAAPAASSAATVDAATTEPGPRPAPQFRPAPLLAAANAPVKQQAPVRDLVEQTRVAAQPVAPPAVAPVHVATVVPGSVFPVQSLHDTVPFLRAMSPEFRRTLPEMVVNIHVYAANVADRILYINNRPIQAGEKVNGDVLVEEIVEDGAVLNFRGQRFKLPRPS